MQFNLFKRKNKEAEKRGLDFISFSVPAPKFSIEVAPLAISAVFRAIMLISDSCSVLPFNVVKKKNGDTVKVPNHPLNLIFSDKSDMTITWMQFIKQIVQEMLLKGNSYAYVYRNNDGSVKKLRFLRNSDVVVDYDEIKDKLYYKCSYVAKGRIEAINMLHFKKFSFDGVHGESIIKIMWRTLQIGTAQEKNALSTFENGGTKIGYIKSSVPIGAEQKQQIVQDWSQAYSGPTGTDYSRIAVLGHNLDYQSINSSAEENELLSSRLFTVSEVARFFGINPVLLEDLSHSSYNTIEASLLQFLSQTLQPYLRLIETEMSRKLFRPSENNLFVDIDDYAVLLSDKSTLANYYSTLVSNGIMTLNEARQNLDLPAKEGCDDLLIPYTDLAQNTVGNTDQNDEQTEKQEV